MLEAYDVLCLKALRALFHLKFHRLTLIQRLITVHLKRGEMHEHIFAGLTLDEPVTLRTIEPLHRALFLHLHYLVNKNCFVSLGPSAWYSDGSDAPGPSAATASRP